MIMVKLRQPLLIFKAGCLLVLALVLSPLLSLSFKEFGYAAYSQISTMRGYLAFLLSHTLLLSGLPVQVASITIEVAPPQSTTYSVSSPLDITSTSSPSYASSQTLAEIAAATVTPSSSSKSPVADIVKIYNRRLSNIAATVTDGSAIQNW
jgi:hypothetical protein